MLDEAAFLSEVRAFLDVQLTPDLREAGRNTIGVHSDMAACRLWQRRLHARGWIAPTWPRAYGGAEWGARQRYLFDRECVANDAPVLFAGGIRSLGPLLIESATEAQKARYLPAILTGEDMWCQGFSEPGAGTDLAAVATRARRQGEQYVVNGTKIWTTGAHLSNRMFALVRTCDRGKRQEGLTFLLIDMDSPGLTVKPILGLAGDHECNQIFFDDVAVPVENRVGAENDGWSVAKRLMQLARSNNTPSALVRRSLKRAREALVLSGASVEPSLRHRLSALDIELSAYEQLELASLPSGRVGGENVCLPSMLKLTGTELHQRVVELAAEISGPYGAGALAAIGVNGIELDRGARAMAKHFAVRAATIYSGASEMQRNVIAKQLLS